MKTTDPIVLFRDWYQEAIDAGITDPSIMTLATVDGEGNPAARIVLLKSFDENGFVFYTNYQSRKGTDLEKNPRAALVLHWRETGHQVRIEGITKKVQASASDRYFESRPRGSQLGAWASEQSREIPSKAHLDESLKRWESEFRDQPVPRPPYWGGYRVIPDKMEFWSDRENRMHERMLFEKTEQGWVFKKLAP
ncbi:MAG: pyridoxamine 5'-phosphate oxidase [Bacteroidales bacterium]|nr:pyridoxamine 5'-phosphate oxidase [Bacteroidales bacterium]